MHFVPGAAGLLSPPLPTRKNLTVTLTFGYLLDSLPATHNLIRVLRAFTFAVREDGGCQRTMRINWHKTSHGQSSRSRRLSWFFGNLAPILTLAIALTACGGVTKSSPSAPGTPSDPGISLDPGTPSTPGTPAPPPGPDLSAAFFGMHMHTGVLGQQPWPTDSFGGLRLWNTGTAWSEINTRDRTYNWSVFDEWLTAADAHGVSNLLYTFGRTPTWASSNPGDTTCAYTNGNGSGQCWPPNDLNSDGTGSNQHWKDFVTALVAHNASKSGSRVKYWEIWNEFDQPITWKGSNAQLARLAQDARTIILAADPAALVLTPSSSTGLTATASQMKAYLATPGASNAADAIAIHPYVQQSGILPIPEDVVTLIGNVKNILSGPDAAKPLWSTEGSWGVTKQTGFTDPDQQAAFTARYLVLQQSAGITSLYWYEWNNTIDGTLWYPTGTHNCTTSAGCITRAGVAYQQIYVWTVGAMLASPCSATGTIWKCQLTRANGYLGEVVWDTSQTCQDGLCTTSQFALDSQFVHSRDLTGVVTNVSGSPTVAIGAKPILLENQ